MQNTKLPIVLATMTIVLALLGSCSKNKPEVQVVNIQAFGDTENAAIEEAKRNAIAKVCGEIILGSSKSQSETEKSTKLNTSGENSKSFNSNSKMSDENLSLVGGSVKSYSIKNKRQENGKYFVEIEANITDCRKSDDVTNALTGGDRNGLISNPTNLAEKYSNARSLAQRGESDRALKIYEKLLEEKIIYADPILDMVLLAKKVYGSSGAKEYIQKSFSQIKNRPEYFFALELISNEPVDGAWEVILNNSDSFPPLIDAYFNNHENYCIEKFPPQNDKFPEMKFNNCRNEIIKLEKIQSIVSKLEIIKKSGEYGNFFLDPYKAKDYSENMWNSVYLKTLENSVKSLENSVAALKKNEVNLSRANDAMERLNEIKKKQKDVNDAQQTDLKNKYPNLFKD